MRYHVAMAAKKNKSTTQNKSESSNAAQPEHADSAESIAPVMRYVFGKKELRTLDGESYGFSSDDSSDESDDSENEANNEENDQSTVESYGPGISLVSSVAIDNTGRLAAVAVGTRIFLIETATSQRTAELFPFLGEDNEPLMGEMAVYEITNLRFTPDSESVVAEIEMYWNNNDTMKMVSILDCRTGQLKWQQVTFEQLSEIGDDMPSGLSAWSISDDGSTVVLFSDYWGAQVFDIGAASIQQGSNAIHQCVQPTYLAKLRQQMLTQGLVSRSRYEKGTLEDDVSMYISGLVTTAISKQDDMLVLVQSVEAKSYVAQLVSLRGVEPSLVFTGPLFSGHKSSAYKARPVVSIDGQVVRCLNHTQDKMYVSTISIDSASITESSFSWPSDAHLLGVDDSKSRVIGYQTTEHNKTASLTVLLRGLSSTEKTTIPLSGTLPKPSYASPLVALSQNAKWLIATNEGVVEVYQIAKSLRGLSRRFRGVYDG